MLAILGLMVKPKYEQGNLRSQRIGELLEKLLGELYP